MSEGNEKMTVTDAATVATYDVGAKAYQARYNTIGPRIEDIARGFEYCGVEKPSVVEIGPGSGREASILVEKAGKYIGVDVSSSMVELARAHVPEGEFIVADVINYNFPDNVDIVFAFASLLHLNKTQMHTVLSKISQSLTNEGVIYLSLKRKDKYIEEYSTDQHGTRKFCYYSKDDLLDITPPELKEVYYDEQHHGRSDWFTIILKKV